LSYAISVEEFVELTGLSKEKIFNTEKNFKEFTLDHKKLKKKGGVNNEKI
jgi:hypothetical protein